MILQRLGRSIRNQDWFTVTIELIVVVVGIFLGLQVTDWNDARKARADERLYLERLHDELVLATDQIASRAETLADWKQRCVTALEAMNAGDLGEMTAEEFGWALILVQRNSLVDSEITTIEELIATGNLAKISDADLRNRIAESYLTTESLGRYIELVAARTATLLPILHTRFQPSIDGTSLDRIIYDFDRLAADTEFINAYANALNMLSTNEWWMNQAVEEFRALRDEVALAIGRNGESVDEPDAIASSTSG